MRDPSLIFRPELMRAVDATHSEHHRRQPERARVIEDVLIGSTLRTPVRTVEIKPLIFGDTSAGRGFVDRMVTFAIRPQIDVVQAAIDLVSRCEYERRRITLGPKRL